MREVIRHLVDGAADKTGSERRLRFAAPWHRACIPGRPWDEAPIAAASAKRLGPAIVLAVGLMLLWLVAYWYLSPLSWDLVQLSRQGPRALALSVTGHYRDAARAYRAGQHGMLRVPYVNDPAGYNDLR